MISLGIHRREVGWSQTDRRSGTDRIRCRSPMILPTCDAGCWTVAPIQNTKRARREPPVNGSEGHTRRFTFLLVPNFPMLAFSSAVEPLRIANWLSGRQLYEWCVLTSDGHPVPASNGLLLSPHAAIDGVPPPPLLLVGAGVDGCFFSDERVFMWLRALARQGMTLGAFGTGTWLLARAGVLAGHRCTLHWEDIRSFREAFPNLAVTERLFEIDGRRMTCPGGTATMDLILKLVAEEHGREFASAIAEEFMQDQVRDGERSQRMDLIKRIGFNDPRLLSAILLMERHIEAPLSVAEISEACGASVRNLERLFRLCLSRSPTTYYRDIRLNAARQLLLHGSNSILDVAIATGFVSASHFARCYRTTFGHSPRDERSRARQTGPRIH